MDRLSKAFLNCEKLQQHVKFLLAKGASTKIYNRNLLYHGYIPLNEDGSFMKSRSTVPASMAVPSMIFWRATSARLLWAYRSAKKTLGRDIMWYIWLNPIPRSLARTKMATFERYFLAEKETHTERRTRITAIWRMKP